MPTMKKVALAYWGTGRRKEAVARVRLVPGHGRVIVNGRPMEDYFPLAFLQVALRQPLALTGTEDQYDVYVRVAGGGVSGQAGAVRHGISRALLRTEGEHRAVLKKARKAPQFSKR